MQECDIILNKPFKMSLRRSFRNWLHLSFDAHVQAGKDSHLWNPKLTYGSLKPYVTAWIHEAVECLRTPEMQVAIANSFANDGFFSLMRSPLQRQIALEKISNMESLPVLIPTEVEIEGNTFSDLIADDKDLEIEILNEKMNCHSAKIGSTS